MNLITTTEALGLSFYTLSRLSDVTRMANPVHGVPHLISLGRYKGELVLDALGNFVSFR